MSFLHDIFYCDTRFPISNESLDSLNAFAVYLPKRTLPKGESPKLVDSPNSRIEPICSTIIKQVISKELPDVVVASQPRVNDQNPRIKHTSLFWCVFLSHYGYSEYLRVGNRFQNRELEEKQRIMETLSKNPKELKTGSMKLTNDAIQEILSGLMVSSKEEFSSLIAYAKYYKKTIYVVFGCSYLVFSGESLDCSSNTSENVSNVCVITQTRKHPKYGGSYVLEFDMTLEKLQTICDTKIQLEHYEKPFRGISAFKVADLEKMAKKIGVLDAMKKTELYAKIVEKCCEGIQR